MVGKSTTIRVPSNETERKLCGIWQHILGIGRIGIHDNFFELGGHSLKAMMLLAQIHRETGVEVPLRTLFEMPTVQQIAKFIDQSASHDYHSIQPAEEQHITRCHPPKNGCSFCSNLSRAASVITCRM